MAPQGNCYLYADADTNQIGFATLDGSGNPVAYNVNSNNLSVGTHQIYAKFTGGSGGGITWNPSQSPNLPEQVQSNQQNTNTSITSSANPVVQGQPLSFTVTVVAAP